MSDPFYLISTTLETICEMAPPVVDSLPNYPFITEKMLLNHMKKSRNLRVAMGHLMYNLMSPREKEKGRSLTTDGRGFHVTDSRVFAPMFKGYWDGIDFTKEDLRLLDTRIASYIKQTISVLIEYSCEKDPSLIPAAKKWGKI